MHIFMFKFEFLWLIDSRFGPPAGRMRSKSNKQWPSGRIFGTFEFLWTLDNLANKFKSVVEQTISIEPHICDKHAQILK